MTNVIDILAQSSGSAIGVDELTTIADAMVMLVLSAGVFILLYWAYTTRFGATSLVDVPLRRNNMAFYVPLIPLGVWLLASSVGMYAVGRFDRKLSPEDQKILELIAAACIYLVLLVTMFSLAPRYFARGLKGFGLGLRNIGRNFGSGAVKLIAVYPLVALVLLATRFVGKLILGPQWDIEKHQGLELLDEYPNWYMRSLLIVIAVVIAPCVEEMLFRGFFQTMFRNFIKKPWPAIALTAAMFASAHMDNPSHWPALFVLALGLGYAYERSGSLFQSIFMHAMFNGVSVLATLLTK